VSRQRKPKTRLLNLIMTMEKMPPKAREATVVVTMTKVMKRERVLINAPILLRLILLDVLNSCF
jgi:hypothetical protein